MALTETQKSQLDQFLESAIGHLFLFSENPAELSQEIIKLTAALKDLEYEADEDSAIEDLCRCIRNPALMLHGLTRQLGFTPKISDIQLAILEMTEASLKACLQGSKTKLADFNWDLQTLIADIISPINYRLDFVEITEPAPVTETPWEIFIFKPFSTYYAKLTFDSSTLEPVITLKVFFSETETYEDQFALNVFLSGDEDEKDYPDLLLQKMLPAAKKAVLENTKEVLIDYLLTKEIITIATAKHLQQAGHLVKFITNIYYFHLIVERKLSFDHISSLTLTQIKSLTNENVISFIKGGLCSFSQAKHLTTSAIKLITLYQQLIYKEKLTLDMLLETTEEQRSILTISLVANLIHSGHLPFDVAIAIPSYFKPVFFESFYQDYFLREAKNITWPLICTLTKKQCKKLLTLGFQQLIASNVIDLNDTPYLQPELLEMLSRENIKDLLCYNVFDLCTLIDLTLPKIALLDFNPVARVWLISHIISLDEFKNWDVSLIITIACARRYYRIAVNDPYDIFDCKDTFENIEKDLPKLAKLIELNVSQLKAIILDRVLVSIGSYVKNIQLEKPALCEKEKKYFQEFRSLLKNHQRPLAIETLEMIATLAEDIIAKIPQKILEMNHPMKIFGFTLFEKKQPQYFTKLHGFCANLLQIHHYFIGERKEMALNIKP